MKIICIGRNYGAHARELGNALPEEPVFFLKPSTALLLPGSPIRLPAFSTDVQHELEVVFRVAQGGSAIPEAQALSHLDAYTLGLDLTARDVQNEQKAKGLPWEKAKAWDGSAPISDQWVALDAATDLSDIRFELERNGTTVQQGNTADMLFPVSRLVAYVSKFITFEPGDLLFTGTPEGVGPITSGDVLTGRMDGRPMLSFDVA